MIVVRILFLLKLTLASKSDDVVLNSQLEIILFHARELSFKHDLILVLIDVNAGVPGAASNSFLAEAAGKVGREQAIHFFL
jgi:hypothetical protein